MPPFALSRRFVAEAMGTAMPAATVASSYVAPSFYVVASWKGAAPVLADHSCPGTGTLGQNRSGR